MKTGSYFTTIGLPGRIAISLAMPKDMKGTIPEYQPLAPKYWFFKKPKPEYEAHFKDQLRLLDPNAVYARLEQMACGHEPILLCYERPPFSETNWCHRRMVAEWFETSLGVVVPEYVKPGKSWSGPSESNGPQTLDMFK